VSVRTRSLGLRRPRFHHIPLIVAAVIALVVTGVAPGSRSSVAHADTPTLTGTFYGDDNSVYYLQQVGDQVWWAGESVDQDANPNGGYLGPGHVWSHGLASTSVFQGTVSQDPVHGPILSGKWVDVSRGANLGTGTITLTIGIEGTHAHLVLAGGTFRTRDFVQGDPVDDSIYQYPDGHTEYIPFYDRFQQAKKGVYPGLSVNDDNGDPLGSTHNPAQLRPYRDQTVFYGELVTHNHNGDEAAHLNLATAALNSADGRSYSNFACHANDGDLDLRMLVDGKRSLTTDTSAFHLPTDFPSSILAPTDPGVGWGSENATDEGEHGYDHQDILSKFPNIGASTTDVVLFGTNYGSPNDAIKRTQGIADGDATTSYVGTEGVMYAGNAVQGCPTSAPLLLPGWAAKGGNSILVNSRPINNTDSDGGGANIGVQANACEPTSQTAINALNGMPLAAADPHSSNLDPTQSPDACAKLGYGTQVRVTGALILDCGHSDTGDTDTNYLVDGNDYTVHNCDQLEGTDFCFPFCSGGWDTTEEDQNQELHPFYSYDIIECPLGNYPDGACPGKSVRPNLTGAWGSDDGGTYYVRQMGDKIWWLGLRRNRDPIMSSSAVPIPNPTNVFEGTISSYKADGTAVISGNAVTVPKGGESGGEATQATFTVDANNKHIDLTSLAGNDLGFPFPSHFDKLYEPQEDTTPPSSTLTIGDPQYQANSTSSHYVTSGTPLTIKANDGDTGQGVQTLWFRYFQGPLTKLASSFTPIVLDSPATDAQRSFKINGPDGSYTVQTFATDASGNDESIHTTHLTLDNSPPRATINQPTASNYTRDAIIKLGYSVDDGTGSGLQSFTPTLDGSTTTPVGGSLRSGDSIDLLNDNVPLGSHTFTITATDNIGNTGPTSVIFTVAVTPASIENDVKRYLANGKIKSKSLASALLTKLVEAATYRSAGDCADSDASYFSFINQVMAQSGKGIDPSAAKIMIEDANYLIAHCP
jgi:hypothetical protein